MEAWTFRRARVEKRLLHSGHEFALAAGQRRHAALALGPIAWRQIEERLRKAVLLEAGCDVVCGKIIGEKKFDAGESAIRGGREPVEKRRLLEHHAEIGGKFWHGLSFSRVRNA